MKSERWERIEHLFATALELDPSLREEYLAVECASDPELREEVEAMLEVAGDQDALLIESRLGVAQEAVAPADPLGRTIGQYRVEELIGRGGMGEVYRAVRDDGEFDQRVALKIVSGVIPSSAAVGRFKTERQILARLEHPHIARLLDGGTTPAGRPYIVMELVDGVPITDYCEQRGLGLRERLELFRTVCDAVQYAHQNLVIHRDLKPSNILVSASGVVKLLDFGIAKLLEDGQDASQQTVTGALLLTPDSAAPEQIQGGPITTATDVYGLGVLLYRLLTGRPPYGDAQPSPSELRDWILDGQPVRPSMVLEAAARRRVRGELDTIVLQALRKEPERRYGSASALSDDIGRYLAHEPIQALPDSAGYRLRKFIRRHRTGTAAAAMIAALVLGFAGLTTAQSRVIQGERDRAEQTVQILVDLFETSDPTFTANADTMRVSAFIDRSRDRVIEELSDDPALQLRMMYVLGRVYSTRGRFAEARELLQEVFDRQHHDANRPDSFHAQVTSDLGRVRARLEGPAAADFLRQSVDVQRAANGARHPSVAYALATLAEVVEDRSEGRALLQEAFAIQQRALSAPHVELANSLNQLGVFAYLDGDYSAAVERWRESRHMLSQIRPPDSPDLMTLTSNMAQGYTLLGDAEGALEVNLDLLARRQRVLGDSAVEVGVTLNSIGLNHAFLGDLSTAEQYFRSSVAVFDAALGGEMQGGGGVEYGANARRNLGVALHFQGDLRGAADWMELAVRRQANFAGEDSEATINIRAQRANVLIDDGRVTAAADSLGVLVAQAATDGGSVALAEAQTWLGRAHVLEGRSEAASRAFTAAAAFRSDAMGPESGPAIESALGEAMTAVLLSPSPESRERLAQLIEAYRDYGLHVPDFLNEAEGVVGGS